MPRWVAWIVVAVAALGLVAGFVALNWFGWNEDRGVLRLFAFMVDFALVCGAIYVAGLIVGEAIETLARGK